MIEYTGRDCEQMGERCPDEGQVQYCGYCAAHWILLSDEQRKILLEQKAQPAPVYRTTENHTHHHSHYNPPQSRIFNAVIVALASGGGLTAAHYLLRWLGQ